jgi:hypothetical protein
MPIIATQVCVPISLFLKSLLNIEESGSTGMQITTPVFSSLSSGTWLPDPIVRGPFDGMQGGAAAALMCSQVEALAQAESLGFVSAFTAHFLRAVPLEELMVRIEPLRQGRRVSIIDTQLSTGSGKVCAVGRATLIAITPNAILPIPMSQKFEPDSFPLQSRAAPHGEPWLMDAMETRIDRNGMAWFRLKRQIANGQGAMTGVLPAADWAHGILPPMGADQWPAASIPNPDVTVHLFRAPCSAWIGLAPASAWSRTGVGVGWAALYGEEGIIGQVAMSIAVTPRTNG